MESSKECELNIIPVATFATLTLGGLSFSYSTFIWGRLFPSLFPHRFIEKTIQSIGVKVTFK
jgi:hypothetical protein